MPDIIVTPNEILNVLVFLSVLGIIGVFLAKLYNILHRGQQLSIQQSTILLMVGIICLLFIEVGLMINVPSIEETSLLEFNFYNWFARIFIILIWIFWFIELFFHSLNKLEEETTQLTRMKKRRQDRLNMY